MSNAVIQKLRELKPNFHGSEDEPKNWMSQWDVLEYLAKTMGPDKTSLETGCGYSTVIFAASGAKHTTVTPEAAEEGRVRAFCESIGVDTSNLTFAIGPSSAVLPTLDGPLDLMYIDGAHGFPHPCIDWMYTEDRLNVGGAMLVDDIRIPTCRIVHDFLLKENNWSFDQFIGDTSIFEKTAQSPNSAEWMKQGFNAKYPDFSFLPASHNIATKGRHVLRETVKAVGLEQPARRLIGK